MEVQSHSLFYPMLALFIWTFLIMLRNMQVRLGAVLKRQLTNEYFELFRGGDPSETILKAQNHLRNLTEVPPLFYIVGLAVMVAGKTDSLFVILAWSYVALRVGHGMVHLTFNKVPPRFAFFILSNLVLLAMWGRLGLLI
ncbi:MAG: MAPEG family protein [Deltaproteobacteria bacterium]|nr:MAPEG family protein [Deltaproteobacteria bacterium]